MEKWINLLFAVLAISAVAYTVTKSAVFRPWRLWVNKKSDFFGDLFACPYCFSHWLTFLTVGLLGDDLFVVHYRNWAYDYVITAFAMVALAAPVVGYLIWRAIRDE